MTDMRTPQLFSQPKKIYKTMLADIRKAHVSIHLETYIFDDDLIGQIFRDELIKKAQQGVRVFLLIDAWGSSADKSFFTELQAAGGKVRFFREFQYVFRIFRKNHERNHRKLLIIDKKIAYIGSINYTESCLEWRELVLRFKGDIVKVLLSSFRRLWKLHDKWKHKMIKTFVHEKYKIIHDAPLHKRKRTHTNYVKLLNQARDEIIIESPFFVPTKKILRALFRAVKRQVSITIVVPLLSDVRVADILRERYLGRLHQKGIKIFYYKPNNLHSKLLIIDKSLFLFGSSNLDYRSFTHQFELNMMGTDEAIITKLLRYHSQTLRRCKPFNFAAWKRRGLVKRLFERFLLWFEEYF